MKYKDRSGEWIEEETITEKIYPILFGNPIGRFLTKPFTSPMFSKFIGAVLDCRLSVILTLPYKKMHKIDMKRYKPQFYESFNAFFMRETKEEYRVIDEEIGSMIAPAEGRMMLYPITEQQTVTVKGAEYSISSLLKSKKLASRYAGGNAMVVHLSGGNSHHYCYVAEGIKGKNHYLQGNLQAFHPIHHEQVKTYWENSREFCRIRTEHFGEVIQMEVGALSVGRICNLQEGIARVKKGEEKGCFAYGGSAIVVLFEKDRVDFDEDLVENSEQGVETMVRLGERVGYRKMKDSSMKFFSL